eukprot:1490801-Rhodomonas_salina.1
MVACSVGIKLSRSPHALRVSLSRSLALSCLLSLSLSLSCLLSLACLLACSLSLARSLALLSLSPRLPEEASSTALDSELGLTPDGNTLQLGSQHSLSLR